MKPKRGRHTKLTEEVEAAILNHVRQGFTLGASARTAGVPRSTLFDWLRRGDKERRGIFRTFRTRLRAAQKQGLIVAIKANPRPIRRARTEAKEPDHVIRQMAYVEVGRVIDEGRVPPDIAREALEMVLADVDDRLDLAEERRSWEEIDRRN